MGHALGRWGLLLVLAIFASSLALDDAAQSQTQTLALDMESLPIPYSEAEATEPHFVPVSEKQQLQPRLTGMFGGS